MARRNVEIALLPESRQRVAHALLAAITHTLSALAQGDERSALRDGFRAVARGIQAERAFLARVEGGQRVGEVLFARGLSPVQAAALQSGSSSPGVSPTLVRRALASERVQVVEDARLLSQRDNQTGALATGDYSVACAAVRDPLTRAALAVLYLQTTSLRESISRQIAPYVDAYALALGHAWKLWDRGRAQTFARADQGAGPELVGESAWTRALHERIERIVLPAMAADRPDPLLILGETGTGKDVLARHLHARSVRAKGAFVAVNCGTLTGDLLQTTLFGHRRGAFTGAFDNAEGDFVAADRGVLFLDELGDLPADGQVSLLRALETRRVRGVGMREERAVDVQIVCATNKDLLAEIDAGRFRLDLFQRVSGLTLRLAPLRERPDDVPPLLSHFLRLHERRLGKGTLGLTRDVLERLLRHAWPGNVRELNWLCSALVLHAQPGRRIDHDVLVQAAPHMQDVRSRSRRLAADARAHALPTQTQTGTLAEAAFAFERSFLLAAGRETGWRRAALAERLGTSRTALYMLLKKHGMKEAHDDER